MGQKQELKLSRREFLSLICKFAAGIFFFSFWDWPGYFYPGNIFRRDSFVIANKLFLTSHLYRRNNLAG